MDITTVEMVSYRLKDGITQHQVNATHLGVNQLLQQQPGFYYRSLSCDETGQWFDIAYWKDMDCAKLAGDAFMGSSAGQALIALIDNDTISMRHMEVATETSGESCAA
jgi:hypothetical protein